MSWSVIRAATWPTSRSKVLSQLSLCLLSVVDTYLIDLMCSAGINVSLLSQGPQTHVSARLRDFIVLNVDPKSLHKKVSQLSEYVNAAHLL